MDQETPNKEYFGKKDISKIFGYGRDKTKRFLESGLLPVVKINNDYIISKAELDIWIKKNSGKALKF